MVMESAGDLPGGAQPVSFFFFSLFFLPLFLLGFAA